MSDAVRGNDVSLDDAGHGPLAINIAGHTDAPGALGHLELVVAGSGDGGRAGDAVCEDGGGDNVPQKDLGEGGLVLEETIEGGGGNLGEGSVGRGEDGEGSTVEGVNETSGLDGGDKGGEVGVAGELLNKGLVGQREDDLVDNVDDTVVGGDVGLDDPLAVHGEERGGAGGPGSRAAPLADAAARGGRGVAAPSGLSGAGVAGAAGTLILVVLVEPQRGALEGVGDELVAEVGGLDEPGDDVEGEDGLEELDIGGEGVTGRLGQLGKGLVGGGEDGEGAGAGEGAAEAGVGDELDQSGEAGVLGHLRDEGGVGNLNKRISLIVFVRFKM